MLGLRVWIWVLWFRVWSLRRVYRLSISGSRVLGQRLSIRVEGLGFRVGG